jgi:hypothetical protein
MSWEETEWEVKNQGKNAIAIAYYLGTTKNR